MKLTIGEIHLLARLARDRGLYAECKGDDLGALQELGLLQWFDARSSSTPFNEDPRPLFKLLGISGRTQYFWVQAVENWRKLVGPEASADVDAINALTPALIGLPQAFAPLMRAIIRGYLQRAEKHGAEPDGALLAPIFAAFGRLQAPHAALH